MKSSIITKRKVYDIEFYDPSISYNLNDLCIHGGIVYKSLVNNNKKHPIISNDWTQLIK